MLNQRRNLLKIILQERRRKFFDKTLVTPPLGSPDWGDSAICCMNRNFIDTKNKTLTVNSENVLHLQLSMDINRGYESISWVSFIAASW